MAEDVTPPPPPPEQQSIRVILGGRMTWWDEVEMPLMIGCVIFFLAVVLPFGLFVWAGLKGLLTGRG